METKQYLQQIIAVVVERPLGSRHPRWGFVYPVNYGYVPNTVSGDGEPLDVYVLQVEEPLKTFTGICIAVIHRLDDNDDKLVVVPVGINLTDAEIQEQTAFQEQFFQSVIIR